MLARSRCHGPRAGHRPRLVRAAQRVGPPPAHREVPVVSADGPARADLRPRRLLVAAMLTALALLGPRAAGVAQAASAQPTSRSHPGAAGGRRARALQGDRLRPRRHVATVAWDFDDDGEFDDATGATATRTFAVAGAHIAGRRVTDKEPPRWRSRRALPAARAAASGGHGDRDLRDEARKDRQVHPVPHPPRRRATAA